MSKRTTASAQPQLVPAKPDASTFDVIQLEAVLQHPDVTVQASTDGRLIVHAPGHPPIIVDDLASLLSGEDAGLAIRLAELLGEHALLAEMQGTDVAADEAGNSGSEEAHDSGDDNSTTDDLDDIEDFDYEPVDFEGAEREGKSEATGGNQFQTAYESGDISPGLVHLPALPEGDLLATHDIIVDNVGVNTAASSNSFAEDGTSSFDAFSGLNVGAGLEHLIPLGNTEYGSRGFDSPVFQTSAPRPSIATDDVNSSLEDETVEGNIFANDTTPNGFTDLQLITPPENGTLMLNADGSYVYTPDPHFSGEVSFTYQFTDPVTAQVLTADVGFSIAAVADAPIVTGGASGEEDTTIDVPISVQLVDTDGSESITSVTISGVPSDVVLSWDTVLPGSVQPNGNGTFTFTGSTEEIQNLLASVAVTPPLHSDGDFVLTVTANTLDSNPGVDDGVAVPTATTIATIPVTVIAVADAPTVSAATTTGLEDEVLVFGPDITYALVDEDGTEQITSVTLTNFPTNFSVGYATAPGATVTLVNGVYTITGDPDAIRQTVDSFNVTGNADGDTDFDVAFTVTTTDNDGSTATTPGSHTINIQAVADTPTGSGTATGREDQPIAMPITVGLGDTDGSESIGFVDVVGLPDGASLEWDTTLPGSVTTLPDGTIRFTGTTAEVQAILQTITVTPPVDSDADFDLTVTVQAVESNPSEPGDVAVPTAIHTFTIPVVVAAVADTPDVGATQTEFTTSEDTPIDLTGLSGSLNDDDASETLSFQVSGVPDGADFGGAGTQTSPGVWTFTPEEIEAGLTFHPPADVSDVYQLTLTAIATEGDPDAAVPTATNSVNFSVTVTAVADAPTVTGASSGNEDSPIAVGANITIDVVDDDTSESLTQVVIDAIPTGAAITMPTVGAAVVNNTGTTITITGDEDDIRATLAGLELTPPDDSDADITLQITATTTDVGGGVTTTNDTVVSHVITVDAVVDAPSVTGGTAVVEDATPIIAVPITVTLGDQDGSEDVTLVVLSGIPADVAVSSTTSLGGVLSQQPDGSYHVTGTTEEIQDLLTNLQVTPPEHSDADFTIGVATTVEETNPSEPDGIAVVTTTVSTNVNVVITAQADTPTGPTGGSITVTTDEDTEVAIPIPVGLSDTDGSETIQSVVISGIPDGAIPAWSAAYDDNVVFDATAGTITVTGDDADIQDMLTSFSLTPPEHDDTVIGLNVAVTSAETNPSDPADPSNTTPSTEILNFPITVHVTAVADEPTITPDTSSTGLEDTPIPFGGDIAYQLADTDGTEQITEVTLTGFPADSVVTFDTTLAGTVDVGGNTASGPITITGGDTITITGADEDEIRALLDSFAVQAPDDSDVNFTLDTSVTTTDTDTETGDQTTQTTTGTHDIVVEAVADLPSGSGAGSGDEDTSINTPITVDLGDTDGSETYASVVISGIPDGATPSWDSAYDGFISFSPGANGAPGTVTVDGTGVTAAQVEAALLTFAVQPPEHSDEEITLSVTVTATETNPDVAGEVATPTMPATFPVTVTVSAFADTPDVEITSPDTHPGTGAPNFIGDEDTAITLDDGVLSTISFAGGLVDGDTSETLTFEIRGVPAGGSFNLGAPSASDPTVWEFAAGDINGSSPLTFTPPAQSHGEFPMELVAIATETTGPQITDAVAENATPFVVTVNPVLDDVSYSGSATTVDEDTVIPLGADIAGGFTLDDTDGSQDLSVSLSGIPANVVLRDGDGNVIWPTSTSGGFSTYEITDPNAQDAFDYLNGITATAPEHTDAGFTVTVNATTTEADGSASTTSGTHQVNIEAVADPVTITGGTTADEDPGGPVALPVGVVLDDQDLSETLQSVTIELTGGSAVLNWTPSGAVMVDTTTAGTYVFTGTTAEIQDTLATIEATLAPNNGDDVTFDVTAITEESNPTDGDVSELTETTAGTLLIDVNPIADTPGVTVPDPGNTNPNPDFVTEEDTPILLTGLGGSLADTDTSETLTFEISDVPSGATFNGAGTDEGSGVWSFTAAEIAAGISFVPPANIDSAQVPGGEYTLTLTSIATENDTGSGNDTSDDVARNSDTFTIQVTPEADAPNVSGSSTGQEDTPINFGSDVTVQTVETDGTETISEIVILAPAGTTVTHPGTLGSASVSIGTASGGVTTYTITSSSGDRATAEADIQALLDDFALNPVAESDENVTLQVSATTTDADGSTATTGPVDHVITVEAVADMPSASANDVSGLEDTSIQLQLGGLLGDDTDGSEVLSAIVTFSESGWDLSVPAGGSVVDNGDGSFTITSSNPADFATVLSGVVATPPEHFSGVSTGVELEIISTETGLEIAAGSETASATTTFDITVGAIADTPPLDIINATGGAAGYEDTPIRLNIRSSLVDDDTSEVLTVQLSNVPDGAVFNDGTPNSPDGTNNGLIGTNLGSGVWSFTEAELALLHIIPPLNYNGVVPSSPGDVDFTLNVEVTVTEQTLLGVANEVETATVTGSIDVEVIGVADAPITGPGTLTVDEDIDIPLGQAVMATQSDADGSETLSYVFSGFPPGVTPSVGTFIGGGRWQVSQEDIGDLTIPSPANWSGDYTDPTSGLAPDLSVRIVSQENDGDQTFVDQPISVTITPVMDAVASVDGSVSVTEGNDIPLANAVVANLIDNDGSESVTGYAFDLNSVAGLDPNVVGSVQDLIDNHVSGVFTDLGGGVIAVLPENLAGISLDAAAFTDSNVDFSIGTSVTFSEPGATDTPTTVTGTFNVNIVGDADTPTVFADGIFGEDATLIEINPTGAEFGGVSTDTDVDLGRTPSESLYYVVSGLPTDGSGNLAFVDGTGASVGLNNGDGTWVLSAADLTDLHLNSSPGSTGVFNLMLTSIATENDGDTANNSIQFTVTLTPSGNGNPTPPPLAPTLVVNSMTGDEDGSFNLDVSASPGNGDPTNPSISIIISNVPAGATVTGATFNTATGQWVVPASTANLVTISPPPDYAGALDFSVEAVATNASFQGVSSGVQPATADIVPVADGPSISASPAEGSEDTPAALNLTVGVTDIDGASPEQLQGTIRVTLSQAGAQLLDATGVPITAASPGVYELTTAQLAGLRVMPPPQYHGVVSVTVEATTEETIDTSVTATSDAMFDITFEAVADEPILQVVNATGDEDSAIAITDGTNTLSAMLADQLDGSETISVTISGIPEDSLLSAGSNNGDGSWTIDPTELATLTITPPPHFSGDLNLSLNAYSLEGSNGDTATTSLPFTVTVAPVADTVSIDPLDVTVEGDGTIILPLNVLSEDTSGTTPDPNAPDTVENPPETVQLTFTGVPAGSQFTAPGGTIVDNGSGEWVFNGTPGEAAAISLTAGEGDVGTHTITVTAIAIDNGDIGTLVNTQDFELEVTAPTSVTLTGTSGADTLTGGNADDTISGADGDDILTGLGGVDLLGGGDGADTFVWQAGDQFSGPDTITDFGLAENDVLDLSALLPGFDAGTDDLSNFVNLFEDNGNTTVQIDPSGSGSFSSDVVTLDGVTGLDLNQMQTNGNIVA
ncbi:MAG: Ig-like domain-containing protein [Pseudomonadota bacterium]